MGGHRTAFLPHLPLNLGFHPKMIHLQFPLNKLAEDLGLQIPNTSLFLVFFPLILGEAENFKKNMAIPTPVMHAFRKNYRNSQKCQPLPYANIKTPGWPGPKARVASLTSFHLNGLDHAR